MLSVEGVFLELDSVEKEKSIEIIGEHMSRMGYVEEGYYNYMLERENKSTTYIGNYVAIPHGTLEGKAKVKKTGIVINQYPNGIDFGNGNIAYFLIGIAGKNNEHVDLIANIADIIEDEERVLELAKVKDREEIFRVFSI